MQKKFEIIPIEDYGVVVDKQRAPKHLEWTFNRHAIGSNKSSPIEKCSKNAEINWANNMSYNDGKTFLRDNFHSVIATINKRIDDIPLIEIEKNEVDKFVAFEDACLECCRGIIFDENTFYPGTTDTREQRAELKIEWLKQMGMWPISFGYKAAGGYNEEDIKKAIEFGKELYLDIKGNIQSGKERKLHPNSFIKSLQPKLPKSVVLEMEGYIHVPSRQLAQRVKITNSSTNTIIPKEILWTTQK